MATRRRALWVTSIELRVRFQDRGVRWPLRDGDTLEVWIRGDLVGVVSGATVRHLLEHHLATATLQAHIQTELASDPAVFDLPQRPLRSLPARTTLPVTSEQREARRQQRKSRRRSE